jgi:GMP synthase (glutamine-hydrolysing)
MIHRFGTDPAMTAAPQVLAIRHVHFEDLGVFARVLAGRGWDIAYREAGIDDLAALDPVAADLLVVLGGPIGAYEDHLYPFLRGELRLLERRLAAGRPTLGICLGAQLMAKALGARVYPGPAKEIGWSPLKLTAAGERSPLQFIGPAETAVLHWHGDTFDLPAGATLLASTPQCAHQAFAVGKNILGLQFHAEVDGAGIEQWLIGHACELAAQKDLSLEKLRADSARHGATLARQGQRLLNAWLDALD